VRREGPSEGNSAGATSVTVENEKGQPAGLSCLTSQPEFLETPEPPRP